MSAHIPGAWLASNSEQSSKRERPDLYCAKCLWLTGGGNCPRHGGEPWTAVRAAEALAKSQAARTEPKP